MKIHKCISIVFSLLFLLSFSNQLQAQDLTYKPVNPAFGGSTFNYQWLLNSAKEQNLLKNPDINQSRTSPNGSTLDDFTASLNRQLLSQLSRQLVSAQFGEEGLGEGSYSIGSFDIEVQNISEGISITINDASTGGQTQVIIPYF